MWSDPAFPDPEDDDPLLIGELDLPYLDNWDARRNPSPDELFESVAGDGGIRVSQADNGLSDSRRLSIRGSPFANSVDDIPSFRVCKGTYVGQKLLLCLVRPLWELFFELERFPFRRLIGYK